MELFVGVMSGTSLDGLDVAVVELGGGDERPEPARPVHFRTWPYEEGFRDRLRAAAEGWAGVTTGELCELDFDLGERIAGAVTETLADAGIAPTEIRAVGSHGQTVWHVPARPEEPGSTLQIGEPAVVAERTGLEVVADFRVRDVAAGGHGAPLTPYFDRLLLSSMEVARAVQNIGGMANVTALRRAGDPGPPVAFDTGPGVALLDGAMRRLIGGAFRYDEGGRTAAAGRVLEDPLREWLDQPFFGEPPPRSTGRERFGDRALEAWLTRHRTEAPEDLIATLTELTARSIAESYRWIEFELDEVVLCGGGARNPELCHRLARQLSPRRVRPLDELGWDGDAREAAAFALLARQHLLGIAVDVSWATGSAGPRILGKRVPR